MNYVSKDLNRSFLDESGPITDIKEVRALDSQGRFTTADNSHRFLKSAPSTQAFRAHFAAMELQFPETTLARPHCYPWFYALLTS